jgi:UDP-N-acetylglucosamine acyltransferase
LTIIAKTADVHPSAQIAEDVEIGSYCVIGPDVKIGPGCRLASHVTIVGHTEIGADNRIFPGAVIGTDPQDIGYSGAPTRVIIGDDNLIREYVTVNRASEKADGFTQIGSSNFLMACCHVAHDCILEDHIIMGNAALLGGHVYVESRAAVSAAVGVHQFTTVGRYSFIGGLSRIVHDVPPYMLVEGHPSRPRSINLVGLKRHGFPPESLEALREAHRLLYHAKMGRSHAGEILRAHDQLTPEVEVLLEFLARQAKGKHGRAREALREH